MLKKTAISIVEIFEDLLEENGILIPDEDRPEDNDAPLYGCTYANLIDDVSDVIISVFEGLRNELKDELVNIINEREGINDSNPKAEQLDAMYLSVTSKLASTDAALNVLRNE